MSQSLNMNADIMLSLLNRLFESALKPKGLKSLNELTNEKLLKKIILEIERYLFIFNDKDRGYWRRLIHSRYYLDSRLQ